ncbi:hypothetical protein M408DRAFT_212656 [Serendipita vermifera MAFF 305830]|uniref:Fork-head domain-containing protein n=1 Tax=Serendipita vermifera MAFF 305830 TaxID=933852 RepID=A0A0C3B1C5_SERVB|nr:hypothetical protein M408DRAFT_212656 [Serendipita vermifera MAFF 305830]
MFDFSESEEEEEDDADGDFVPKRSKGTGRRKGGLGKTRSTGLVRVIPPKPVVASEDQDDQMSEDSQEDGTDEDDQADITLEDGIDTAIKSPFDSSGNPISKRLAIKRKRDAMADSGGEEPPSKRRKSISQAVKTSKAIKKVKSSKGTKSSKESLPKGRKKSAAKPEMKSLFTTTPAPALSAVVAASAAAEAAAGEAGLATKAGGKKGKTQGKKGKKEEKAEKGDGEDEEKEVKEEEAKPTGPPPPKPPFTYPLLCYRALKALNGKAAYRAITKWLETEYPYFAAATKEGKDGWENSTRHTLSSHRAFIKIDRKPEERGKGCFWSFDPEFEEQFKDQWRAAESQARNPRAGGRPPNPPPGPGPNGLGPPPPGMYPRPPPFGQPGPGPGWSGVTPPHLMPGYRPMVPGAGPPGPYPFPPGVPRPPGMLPHPPMHPLPHPMGMPPPPPGAPGAMGKVRAPKKPKQALGAAFSRAPLIRPGLGGLPAGESSNAPGASAPGGGISVDEAIRRGEHAVRMAARAAKDELSGRAPPGTTLVAATGGWGMGAFPPPPPPMGAVNGTAKGGNAPFPGMGMPGRPPATTKVSVVLGSPPAEAFPPHLAPKGVKTEESSSKAEDGPKSPEASTTPSKEVAEPSRPPFRPPLMPMTFFKGTLYLDPKAYPYVEAQDIEKMSELGVGDAMQYLLTKSGGSKTTPNPTSSAPATAATTDSKTPSVSPERDVKTEE